MFDVISYNNRGNSVRSGRNSAIYRSPIISGGGGFNPPDILFTDFAGGLIGGSNGADLYTDGNDGTATTYPSDPTASGRGNVAQIAYVGSGTIIDENRAIYVGDPSIIPNHFFWAMDIYFPNGIFNYSNSAIERKLVYFRDSTNYRDFVLFIWGDQLGYVIETPPDFDSKQRLGIASFPSGQWHRLEGELQFNSSAAASDGLCRVWLNGTLVSEQLNIQLYTAGVPGYGEFMGFGYQREGGTSKDPSDTSCNEVRYLDNIGLSTTRIG